jgi:ribosomal protein S18 acetylase RimI-like enzyme
MDLKQHSILLRPAIPDIEEGLRFAYYLDQAAEGFFRFMLGRESEKIIATSFIASGHSLSHENVLFVEVDKKIVGMSSSFTEKENRLFSNDPLRLAAKQSAFRLKLARVIFAPVWRILETIQEGDFYIQAIAIEPDLRGAGIGSILIKDIENRAKAYGLNRLSSDVSAKNTDAIRLYERLGMVETSRWPNSSFLSPIFIRMSKYL